MPGNQATAVDEFSMETSRGFLNALQELKNLRPQLYSAAEYCEKSYLQNEQKQMVVDNLKDYTVQALVNAVDHLGTVAYKLNDLFQQQAFDISTTELKISYLNQQLLTCQMYADKEGLRQQQLFMTAPQHHKHYILPNSRNRKGQTDAPKQIDIRENHARAKPRPHPSGTPASKTLSWHLASEAESERNATLNSSPGVEDPNSSGIDSKAFQLLARYRSPGGSPFSRPNPKTACTTRDPLVASKPFLAFRSFNAPDWHETSGQPVRSKSVLSAFFVKNKYAKQNS